MAQEEKRPESIVGVTVIAGQVTGFIGLLGAIFAFFTDEWVGVGACLIASALAFGLIANAMLRQ
mgnify:CR=1 FL=1